MSDDIETPVKSFGKRSLNFVSPVSSKLCSKRQDNKNTPAKDEYCGILPTFIDNWDVATQTDATFGKADVQVRETFRY